MGLDTFMPPKTVSRDEWLAARKELLRKEKELTRLRDRLNEERRQLPRVKVEKDYVFDGPDGPERLADLFAGRSQLIVHHFMFGPEWDAGCHGCSFAADHIEGAGASRAPRRERRAGLAGAARQARGLSQAHGLARQMGLVPRQRL